MKFQTRQWGEIPYDDTNVITFPEGLVGFEHQKRFILVGDKEIEPFHLLISIDDGSILFLLLDPRMVQRDYLEGLTFQPDMYQIFSIVTVREKIEETTINLKGPIIIQHETREGRQLILNAKRYSIAHPIMAYHQKHGIRSYARIDT